MTISIKAAFKNILSDDKYNKKNLCLFAVAITIISAIYGLVLKSATPLPIVIFITLFIYMLLMQGTILSLLHNSLFKKEDIFPNIIKDFKIIISTAAKYITACFAYCIAFILIFVIIYSCISLFCPFPHIRIIMQHLIIILMCIVWSFILIGLLFNFSITLKIKELFNIKKSFKFLSESKEFLGSYIIKMLLLIILAIIALWVLVCICIGLLIIILTGIKITPGFAQGIGYITGYLIGTFVTLITILFAADITSQLYISVFEKIKEKQD